MLLKMDVTILPTGRRSAISCPSLKLHHGQQKRRVGATQIRGPSRIRIPAERVSRAQQQVSRTPSRECQLRREIAELHPSPSVPALRVSFSAGVALHHAEDPVERTIAFADQALYAAKAAGRNCVMEERQALNDPRPAASTSTSR